MGLTRLTQLARSARRCISGVRNACAAGSGGRRLPARVTGTGRAAEEGLQASRTICALAVDRLDQGGLEQVVFHLARDLPAHGFDPIVICWKEGGRVARELMRRGVRVYCAWENRARLAQVLEHEAPEVIGSHWVDAAVLREAAQQGIPVVEHVHNMYIWLDEDGWLRERERSRHFAWTLAVSSLVKGYYSNWNRELDPARMAVLPNGIEARADLGPDYRAARERIGIGARDFLIVCLAAYDGIKNQLGLLAAFEVAARRYHEARIICAGSVRNRGYHAQVSRFVSGLSSRSRIHLWAKHAEASRLLAAADLYVVDSFAEGWSLAATEALAAGVPLVHSECGGARELVGEGERGILVPNAAGNPLEVNREVFLHLMAEPEQPNQTALVEAMGRMVEGRDQWQERRPELARAARQQFSLAGQVRGYSEVLERVRTRSPA